MPRLVWARCGEFGGRLGRGCSSDVDGQLLTDGVGCHPVTDTCGSREILNQGTVGAQPSKPCRHNGCDLVTRHPDRAPVVQAVGNTVHRHRFRGPMVDSQHQVSSDFSERTKRQTRVRGRSIRFGRCPVVDGGVFASDQPDPIDPHHIRCEPTAPMVRSHFPTRRSPGPKGPSSPGSRGRRALAGHHHRLYVVNSPSAENPASLAFSWTRASGEG